MTRAVAFLAAALLAATLGAAQNAPSGAAAGRQTSSEVSGQSKTVTGCLSSSSLGDNHFKITDDQDGKVYSLTGLTDQLTSHAGQKVKITGLDNSKASASTNGYESPNPSAGATQDNGTGTGGNSGAAASPTTSGRNSLQVTSVEKLADHCSEAGSAKPQGAGSQAAQRESAQVKLIAYQASDDDGTLAGSSDQKAATKADTAAQNAALDQVGTNDLPRTATALPLLGILGLGSLVAGFIVRR